MKKYIDEVAKRFLTDDDFRPFFTAFHNDNGNIIATNAHILLIAPESHFKETYESQVNFPAYKKIIPEYKEALFSVNTEDIIKVYDTLEKSIKYKKGKVCSECDGEGSQECNLGHEHECEDCNGVGHEQVRDGYEVSGTDNLIKIGQSYFTPEFLYTICLLSKTVNENTMTFYTNDPEKANLIQVNDITIIIMPYKYYYSAECTVHNIATH